MKLILLPLRRIDAKQIFVYSTRVIGNNPDIKPSIQDRVVTKAATTWSSWEQATSGWKKKVVELGNKAINTIDYREHSLKSIISKEGLLRLRPELSDPSTTIQLSHPSQLSQEKVKADLHILADEGGPRHRQKLISSVILMPFTIPFMLIPVVPNIPFFYVAYRAWCHYRAMQGAEHLLALLKEDKLTLSASRTLSTIYDQSGTMNLATVEAVLKDRNPEMIVEVHRAVTQLDGRDEHAPVVSPEEARKNETRSRTGLHK